MAWFAVPLANEHAAPALIDLNLALRRDDRRAEEIAVIYIVLAAIVGILLLQGTGLIPLSSVGGPLTIGFVFLVAAFGVGIHEAWTMRRGPLGWIVNIIASFAGAMIGAQAGGFVVVMLIGAVMHIDGSLARTGGMAMSLALIGGLLATLGGAWAALWIVNRLRPASRAA